ARRAPTHGSARPALRQGAEGGLRGSRGRHPEHGEGPRGYALHGSRSFASLRMTGESEGAPRGLRYVSMVVPNPFAIARRWAKRAIAVSWTPVPVRSQRVISAALRRPSAFPIRISPSSTA